MVVVNVSLEDDEIEKISRSEIFHNICYIDLKKTRISLSVEQMKKIGDFVRETFW
jgi:hypothetical protein